MQICPSTGHLAKMPGKGSGQRGPPVELVLVELDVLLEVDDVDEVEDELDVLEVDDVAPPPPPPPAPSITTLPPHAQIAAGTAQRSHQAEKRMLDHYHGPARRWPGACGE